MAYRLKPTTISNSLFRTVPTPDHCGKCGFIAEILSVVGWCHCSLPTGPGAENE